MIEVDPFKCSVYLLLNVNSSFSFGDMRKLSKRARVCESTLLIK